jgi:ribonuclease Z
MDRLTVTGYSTALFSTWIFLEEMRLLFDAGDGVMAGLMHKSGKIRHVAMSHADRDHVYGLMQVNHHCAHRGLEALFYPAESGFFKGMREACYRFDRETQDGYPWIQVMPGDSFELTPELGLRVVHSSHIPTPGRSVGYVVMRRFRKLKAEFQGLPQSEFERIGREKGSDFLTEPREEPLVGFSGDTGVLPPSQWAGCKLLIHEATFLREEEMELEREGYLHSLLSDVLQMAKEAKVERLLLIHFSSRYNASEIEAAIREHAEAMAIPMPVHFIPPGRIVHNALSRLVWPIQS